MHFLQPSCLHCLARFVIPFFAVFGFPSVALAVSSTGSTTLAKKYTEQAAAAYSAGHADSAIVVIGQAIGQAHHARRTDLEISALASLGVYQRSSGKVSAALATYDRALALALKADKRNPQMAESVASLYINLATLYLDTGQHAQASRYARKAAGLDQWLTNPAFRAQLYPAVGSIFLFNKSYDEAEKWIDKGIAAAIRADMPDSEMQGRCYLAMVLFKKGDKHAMNRQLEAASTLAARSDDIMQKFTFGQTAAAIHLQSGDYAAAVIDLRRLLKVDGIDRYPYIAYDAWNNLHLCYAHRGNYRSAYEALARASALRDSLSSQERGKAMQEMAMKYETREKELKLQASEASRRTEAMQASRRMSLLLLLLAVVSGIGAWSWQRQRTRTEREQRRAEELEREYDGLQRSVEQRLTRRYLEGLESERNRLAAELHDGVAGDLLAIEMRLKDCEPPSASETAKSVENAREAVRTISHNLLPPQFREATLDDVLWDLADRLSRQSNVQVTYSCLKPDAPWTSLPREASMAAYRITQEAVSNSQKHSRATSIAITTNFSPAAFSISISDNGSGLSSHRSAGIGMLNMRRRAEAAGGSLSVTSGTEGTEVRFELPLRDIL